jgi:hypothetical protein
MDTKHNFVLQSFDDMTPTEREELPIRDLFELAAPGNAATAEIKSRISGARYLLESRDREGRDYRIVAGPKVTTQLRETIEWARAELKLRGL